MGADILNLKRGCCSLVLPAVRNFAVAARKGREKYFAFSWNHGQLLMAEKELFQQNVPPLPPRYRFRDLIWGGDHSGGGGQHAPHVHSTGDITEHGDGPHDDR